MGTICVGACGLLSVHLSEWNVSLLRFKKFLLLEELGDNDKPDKSGLRPDIQNCGVEITEITAKWDKEVDQDTLRKVSLTAKPGKLLAVIGPVGAGKSSLLMSVLGELPADEGSVSVKGKVAYVAQQPWVFSATLRQNIVFGNKFDETKYDKIIKVCALNRDMDIMPHGDSTLIGDRGVSLSGGQKARVGLARALYMDADVYLLDDPLSAVDTAVGRHIYEKCIQGYLKKKPCILVTHQLQYLQSADHIIILKEGEVIGRGTFTELVESGVDFSSLLKKDEDEETNRSYELIPPQSPTIDHHHLVLRKSNLDVNKKQKSKSNVDSSLAEMSMSATSLVSIGADFVPETVQLPEEEERKEGTVGIKTYYQYFAAGAGIFKFILLVFINITAQVAYIMSDWWLSYWSNQEEAKHAATTEHNELLALGINITNITIPEVDTYQNIYIFTGIIASVFLFGLLRALLFFKVAVDASQTLHNRMFSSILKTPIAFFDNNPVGRILNRFSKDVGHMDDLLPITFFDFVQCFLLILGCVIVVGAVNPWVFIPTVPLVVVFMLVRRYYIRTSRHIKRLEGTTRSPVFSHLSASLQGLHTIRASNMQQKFMEEFDNHQNLHTESWFLFLAGSRWLAIRLDWLCALFVTSVAFSSVLASENMDAGLVGLSLTYAMTLMGLFQWGVRQSTEVENQMISVERVLEYSRLPSEAAFESSDDNRPPPLWPQHGIISGEKACLKYADDAPLVLKSLNFCIRSKEKVGIVGRTGAGKSSMIAMLFRLVEPSGKLLIDGINILKIGLHDLREKISIIPQDPVLFTGTLRKNLDPFLQHGDDQLWKSLEEVQLKPAIEDLPSGIETEVSEGGINFSVGQRQLICLARAILRKNKILVIDEATANVDVRTDALIQETIREKFKECTVLTIAHRLNTIMDSNRILVMDEGEIMEFDHPYTLLQNSNGYFCKMVTLTGKSEKESLLAVAKASYEQLRSLDTGSEDLNDMVNNGDISGAISKELSIKPSDTLESDTEMETDESAKLLQDETKKLTGATEHQDSTELVDAHSVGDNNRTDIVTSTDSHGQPEVAFEEKGCDDTSDEKSGLLVGQSEEKC